MLIRHGDVLLIPTRQGTFDGLKSYPRDDRGRVILANGEVTGHAHALGGRLTELFGPDEDGNPDALSSAGTVHETFLRVGQDDVLTHEEHAAIPIPAGDYIVRRQREYAPEAIRSVAD